MVYGKDLHEEKRTEIVANRTSTGTFPPGSTWTSNPLRPHDEEGGSNDLGHGQIIDNVKVRGGFFSLMDEYLFLVVLISIRKWVYRILK